LSPAPRPLAPAAACVSRIGDNLGAATARLGLWTTLGVVAATIALGGGMLLACAPRRGAD